MRYTYGKKSTIRFFSPFLTFVALTITVHAQTTQPLPAPQTQAPAPASAKPHAFEAEIAKFEASDRVSPPPQNSVLFVGSSSIRKWTTLAEDFPDVPVLNRGFGGSTVPDSTFYADRIVVPYHPRRIVFYAGDNDLADGHSPERVFADTKAFVEKVRSELPDVPIVLLSIKPSPSRAQFEARQLQTNKLLAAYCASAKDVTYVDVYTPMIGPDGKPFDDMFVADRLHMTPKGYALWTKILTPYVK